MLDLSDKNVFNPVLKGSGLYSGSATILPNEENG